ncbi:MAG: bestrophin family protein [Dehalococcoidia bacterium]|nr:bestrophin family protein [Dehalococcoidia bacterium]
MTLRSLAPVVDAHMVLVAALAVAGTYACRRAGLIVDLPADLVGIAVIFPVVFSIASAYTRREEALRSFAAIKADAASLYYAHRDWTAAGRDLRDNGAILVEELLEAIGAYFGAPPEGQRLALERVYAAFSAISASYRGLLDAGVSRSEISRLGAYLRELMTEFEAMRNFAHYRTPITLRSFSRFFLTIFPLLFTPYFALVGYPEHLAIGYVFAFTYGVVLVGLDNVQEELENPYDGLGPDDLRLTIAHEFIGLLTTTQPEDGPPLEPRTVRTSTRV